MPAEDLGIGSGHVYRRNVRYRSGQSALLQRQLNTLTNASLVSVLSNLTSASGTSSGSNKTVTQDSYDRSQSHRKKRRRRSSREEKDSSSTSPHRYPTSRYERSVFDYMEGDGPSPAYHAAYMNGVAPPAWQQRPTSVSGYPHFEGGSEIGHRSGAARRGSATSMDRMNSDSGISMREGTPEAIEKTSPVARHDSVVEQEAKTVEDDEDDGSSSSDSESDDEPDSIMQYRVGSQEEDLHLQAELQEKEEQAGEHILQSPQPRRYHSFTRPRYDVQPGIPGMPYYSDPYSLQHSYSYPPMPRPPMNGSAMYPGYYQPYSHRNFASRRASAADANMTDDLGNATLAGYELLASKLSEQAGPKSGDGEDERQITPLYRRFEFLNHRILLHLQDEIAEMEEELRRIDEAIAQQQQQQQHMQTSAQTDTTKTPKESPPKIQGSRRDDIRSGLELCERRTMLLGRIYTKLEQYNKAMASYTNAKKSLDTATDEELQTYRSWMEENTPIDKAESKFLNCDGDLVSLGSRNPPDKREYPTRFHDPEWFRKHWTFGNVLTGISLIFLLQMCLALLVKLFPVAIGSSAANVAFVFVGVWLTLVGCLMCIRLIEMRGIFPI